MICPQNDGAVLSFDVNTINWMMPKIKSKNRSQPAKVNSFPGCKIYISSCRHICNLTFTFFMRIKYSSLILFFAFKTIKKLIVKNIRGRLNGFLRTVEDIKVECRLVVSLPASTVDRKKLFLTITQ